MGVNPDPAAHDHSPSKGVRPDRAAHDNGPSKGVHADHAMHDHVPQPTTMARRRAIVFLLLLFARSWFDKLTTNGQEKVKIYSSVRPESLFHKTE